MNQDQMKGKLQQIQGEIKRRWGKLTDDDFTQANGDIQKLKGKIRERSGDQQEQIDEWFNSQGWS
jgi:uncharacterized protein YjbJ (UPF0337 family)